MIVFENLQSTPRLRLFSLLGIDWLATPYAWVSPPLFLVFGILIAFALDGKPNISSQFWIGAGFGLLIYLSTILHTFGHIISSRLARAPVKAHLFTATFPVTLYDDDQADQTRWVHIVRSLGGPVIHLAIALILLAFFQPDSGPFLAFFILLNLLVGIWVLFPFPNLDGWVIWGELFGFRKSIRKWKK